MLLLHAIRTVGIERCWYNDINLINLVAVLLKLNLQVTDFSANHDLVRVGLWLLITHHCRDFKVAWLVTTGNNQLNYIFSWITVPIIKQMHVKKTISPQFLLPKCFVASVSCYGLKNALYVHQQHKYFE